MYLVRMTVSTAAGAVDRSAVHSSLLEASCQHDRLEHVYVRVRRGAADVVLYLLSTDDTAARRTAEQLCRRAMTTCLAGSAWSLVAWHAQLVGQESP